MKCFVVILLIFSTFTVQSMSLNDSSDDDISCIAYYLKTKGLITFVLPFKTYIGSGHDCNRTIQREVDEFYMEINTKKFEHLSVFKMNDNLELRQCMTNIYKLYNVADYYLKGKMYQHLNSTDFEVKIDSDYALENELPSFSSMMCQIDKYVTYQYDLFAEALKGTNEETQEKDCLIEHLIELKKLPSGLSSLIVVSNHSNCYAMNFKHYQSIRKNYQSKPSKTLFKMQPSTNYEMCVRNKATK